MIARTLFFAAIVLGCGCEQTVQVDTRNNVEVSWVELDILRLDSALHLMDRSIAGNAITVQVINSIQNEILDTCTEGCMKSWLNLNFIGGSAEKYLLTDCEQCVIKAGTNDTAYLSFSSEKLTRHIKENRINYGRIDWANSFVELQLFDSTYRCMKSTGFNVCIDTTYDPKRVNNCIKYHRESKMHPNEFRW